MAKRIAPACRVCGCTAATPCPGGCTRVETGLCSRCVLAAAQGILTPDQAALAEPRSAKGRWRRDNVLAGDEYGGSGK